MDYLEYKGYKGSVEYSKADNCLVGKVLGMSGDLIAYEGNTIDELRQDFEAGIDSYLEACEADGVKPKKPYSGKFLIRMTSDLHSRVAMMAAERHTTINDYINSIIIKEVTEPAY
ncbi:MAG: type II toxin-antitoxin system HicB family antitoxin [Bacteroidaceae bacterium]|jgi:predicted HicB family RNase H-like nuclease|nr:type II toxin-antitoxin system HicB family antitoxin [Bacteroidaceae bacterium]MBP3832506.1 type II toxin-antitoxin system HicB family antitoxin [Bacteroidaceae bacterium]